MTAAVIKEQTLRRLQGKVWLNSEIGIPIDDVFEATHYMINGTSGGGKSFLLALIASQYPNVDFFDGKGGQKFEFITKELKVRDEWEFFDVEGYTNLYNNPLKINVRDLYPDVLNVLQIKKDGYLEQVRPALEEFFGLPADDPEKTFEGFRELLVEPVRGKKFYPELFRELKCVLHPKDEGMSIKEFITGKKYIDINGFPVNNRAIGLLASRALQYKKLSKDSEKLLFALDEADTVAPLYTSLNEAFSVVFSQGRSSNISGCVSGTLHTKLGMTIKQNSTVLLFFRSQKKVADAIWDDFGVNLIEEEFKAAEMLHDKGNCVFYSPNFGHSSQKMIYIDPEFFRKEVKKQEEKDYVTVDWSRYAGV